MTFSLSSSHLLILFENVSLRTMRSQCAGVSIESGEWNGQVDEFGAAGEQTASILMNGKTTRVALKVHYDLDVAVRWTSIALGKSQDETTDFEASDFMREYCNLQAGNIQRVFEAVELPLMVSPPFVTVGDDLRLLAKANSPHHFAFIWRLNDERDHVLISVEIEAADLGEIDMLSTALEAKPELAGIEDDSETDFLE